MAELTLEMAAEVVAACQAGADEAGEAISRALDAQIAIEVGKQTTLDLANPPEGWDSAGLLVALKFGDVTLVAVLPESTGLVPPWCADPDPTGESKLSTLAQELGMLLVPETLMADDFAAAHVKNLGEALAAGKPADGAILVPLQLSSGETQGTLHVSWPFAEHNALLPSAPNESSEAAQENQEASTTDAAGATPVNVTPAPTPQAPQPASTEVEPLFSGPRFAGNFSEGLNLLPSYTRSLLRIEVPVVVQLASKKQSIHEIVDFGPGSIISFDKSCDELLKLEVGGLPVATGEAVKVGDKFGLKINAMLMPDERFKKVGTKSQPVG